MSIEAILMPMFAQVALTFVLLFWMSVLRLRAVRSGRCRPQQIALREPNWPPRVIQIANAFHNQLELPMLFYVVIAAGADHRDARRHPLCAVLDVRAGALSCTLISM